MKKIIAQKYEIVKTLGEGGFGSVYLVRHLELGILYALKLIRSQKAKELSFIQRFKREAVVLSRLLHPNSIPLRDFGRTEEGFVYMAMDYCQGQSIQEVLSQEGAFQPALALDITVQILNVMIEAHRLGIIHRDIKPDNIMLEVDSTGREMVKVLDFGIARLAQDLEMESQKATLTQQGAIMGTPMYMSPEQAQGNETDQRSDLYSLGLMLYELLTGLKPFSAPSAIQILMLQMQKYPLAFSELKTPYSLSKAMENLVFRSIQKEPNNRFQSAVQFKEACLQVQAGLSQTGRANRPKIPPKSSKSSGRIKTHTGSISKISTGKNPTSSARLRRPSPSGKTLGTRQEKNFSPQKKTNPALIIGGVLGFLALLLGFFMFSGPKGKHKKKSSSHTTKKNGSGKAIPKKDTRETRTFDELIRDSRLAFDDEDYAKSLAYRQRALKLKPNKILEKLLVKTRGYMLWKQGKSAEKKGHFTRAVQKLERAYQLLPKKEIQTYIQRMVAWRNYLDPLYNKETLVVAKTSEGHFHSIQQAIDKAPPYSRILILPGYYREKLIISKPLEIIGYSVKNEIIIESLGGMAVHLNARRAILRNLHIKSVVPAGQKEHVGITVSQGNVLLERCRISGFQAKGGAGLAVGINIKSLYLKDCHIYENSPSGVWMSGVKNVTFERCEFYKNQRALNIYSSQVTFKKCKVYDNLEVGMMFHETSVIKLEGCEILRHRSPQIVAYPGVNLSMFQCRVQNGQTYGLSIHNKARAVLVDCWVHYNQIAGLLARKGSYVEVNKCNFSKNSVPYRVEQGSLFFENGKQRR